MPASICTFSAYADDINVVLRNAKIGMPLLIAAYLILANATSLRLHAAKCDFIPLWTTDSELVRRWLVENLSLYGGREGQPIRQTSTHCCRSWGSRSYVGASHA
jgi:hypothetical protein